MGSFKFNTYTLSELSVDLTRTTRSHINKSYTTLAEFRLLNSDLEDREFWKAKSIFLEKQRQLLQHHFPAGRVVPSGRAVCFKYKSAREMPALDVWFEQNKATLEMLDQELGACWAESIKQAHQEQQRECEEKFVREICALLDRDASDIARVETRYKERLQALHEEVDAARIRRLETCLDDPEIKSAAADCPDCTPQVMELVRLNLVRLSRPEASRGNLLAIKPVIELLRPTTAE